MPNLEALLKWAEHIRTELGRQSAIAVKPVDSFAGEAAPAAAEADTTELAETSDKASAAA